MNSILSKEKIFVFLTLPVIKRSGLSSAVVNISCFSSAGCCAIKQFASWWWRPKTCWDDDKMWQKWCSEANHHPPPPTPPPSIQVYPYLEKYQPDTLACEQWCSRKLSNINLYLTFQSLICCETWNIKIISYISTSVLCEPVANNIIFVVNNLRAQELVTRINLSESVLCCQ